MSLLSIVVPCYNEEESLEIFYHTVQETLKPLKMDIEYIFVDDGSKDGTLSKLKNLHKAAQQVHYVSFSRNFGKEAAVFAGLRESRGDAVVVLDADLQHPPSVILEMAALWEEGYEVIEGKKSDRGKESFLHKLMAATFYKIISGFMKMDMNDSSDYKFMDRKVVDVLCSLKERNTFFRALSFWTGFKTVGVTYAVQERTVGKTKWSPTALVKYACNNLISFTVAPLYMIVTVGLLFLVIGLVLVIDAVVDHYTGIAVDGYPTLIILIVIATGCILFSIGITGVYNSKIYDEIKASPQYIIRKKE